MFHASAFCGDTPLTGHHLPSEESSYAGWEAEQALAAPFSWKTDVVPSLVGARTGSCKGQLPGSHLWYPVVQDAATVGIVQTRTSWSGRWNERADLLIGLRIRLFSPCPICLFMFVVSYVFYIFVPHIYIYMYIIIIYIYTYILIICIYSMLYLLWRHHITVTSPVTALRWAPSSRSSGACVASWAVPSRPLVERCSGAGRGALRGNNWPRKPGIYIDSFTLWWTNIAMERSTIFNGKIHYKWPFSIAMLVHQRVVCFSWVWFIWSISK